MRIAVLSGKGGTGKTLISVNMAASANEATYIDCDVEEPNGHLFFKPQGLKTEEIPVKIPGVEEQLCNGCRQCVDFCKFNALVYVNHRLMIFDDVCHSCGGCVLFCPEQALSERERVIGEIKSGVSQNVSVISGILNTGEASGIPIIKQLLSYAPADPQPTFIDCPPGSACTVMECVKEADYCLLVAEPTLFGVHNLKLVGELVKLLAKPHGVILNKCLDEQNPAEEYCLENGIRILGRIPFDEELGRLNSKALISVRESRKYQELFSAMMQNVAKEVQHETVINP